MTSETKAVIRTDASISGGRLSVTQSLARGGGGVAEVPADWVIESE